ncbi:hypothetical protein HDV57DRAFT_9387 [Trichoderma longibrachiatum]|uniref:Uncharacterized protein n=1 Tax=Trichoderma longibrachiatum ATCC 18648 TaxID=983965 RepID=A0A2T4CJF4_TRILO|nr:hypothetical protein M440DRAFT_90695 [Trichoderma longibrachiatum ATCC 18648]
MLRFKDRQSYTREPSTTMNGLMLSPSRLHHLCRDSRTCPSTIYGHHGQFSHDGGLNLVNEKHERPTCNNASTEIDNPPPMRGKPASKHPKHLYREHLTKENSHYLTNIAFALPPRIAPNPSHGSNASQNFISIISLPPPGETREEQRSIRLSHGEPWGSTKKKKEMEYPSQRKKHIAKAPIGNLFFLRSRKD